MSGKGRFSFAHLTGRAKSRAMEDEEKPEEEETPEATEDEEDHASGDETEDEATSDDPEQESETEEDGDAEARGRAAERKRIGAILSSKAVNAGNFALAAHLACNTTLPAQEAVGAIKAAPQGGGSLADRMSADPPLSGSAAAAGKGPSLAARMKSKFKGKE